MARFLPVFLGNRALHGLLTCGTHMGCQSRVVVVRHLKAGEKEIVTREETEFRFQVRISKYQIDYFKFILKS